MRAKITIDSASTEQVRALCVALHRVGHTAELRVGVEGPHCWHAETPMLPESEFASVAMELAGIDMTNGRPL